MQIEIKADDLRGKKLFLATPMYGGQCSGFYTKACTDLANIAGRIGMEIQFYFLFNESLITRARNYCVDEFIRSEADYMIFIDSDIVFNFKDVLTLFYLAQSDEKYDIITAAYPKKTIAWEKVAKAASMGKGDDNPYDLEHYAGDFVFNPAQGIKSFRIDEPVEVKEGGTGFMCISKKALIKYAEAYPELKYTPDHRRSEQFDGTHKITAFFDTVIDKESNRYLSEDYMFSRFARDIGLKVWMCPWMQLKHQGMYVYGGTMQAMAAIQESPTSSKRSNRKQYKKGNK